MWTPGPKRVKALSKTLPTLARQAEYQVGVQMRLALRDEPVNIGARFVHILASCNGFLDLRIKALDANFKLQTPWRETRDTGFKTIGQVIRYQLEMNKQSVLWVTRNAI